MLSGRPCASVKRSLPGEQKWLALLKQLRVLPVVECPRRQGPVAAQRCVHFQDSTGCECHYALPARKVADVANQVTHPKKRKRRRRK